MPNPKGINGKSGFGTKTSKSGVTTSVSKTGVVTKTFPAGYKPRAMKPMSQARLNRIFNNKFG